MVGSSVGEVVAGELVESLLDNSELNASIVAMSVSSVSLDSEKKKTFQHICPQSC